MRPDEIAKAGPPAFVEQRREVNVTTTDNQTTTEMQALQDRLTKLSEASLRINEDLDYHSVLQEVTSSARILTDARYGATTVLDDSNRLEEFVTSGLTPEEHRHLRALPESAQFFSYLNDVPRSDPSQRFGLVHEAAGHGGVASSRGRRFPAGCSHPQ